MTQPSPATPSHNPNSELPAETTITVSPQRFQIHKIVLTGGPCGGKSTAQERLATFFEGLGFKIYRSPEIASIMFKGGMRIGDIVRSNELLTFQENLLSTLIAVEDSFVKIAEKLRKKCIIFYDRGTMDGSAYVDESTWKKILQNKGLDNSTIRDNRYDLIVFLESAAINAVKYYEKSPNRTEDVNVAIELDKKTREAWIGHTNFKIIKNEMCENFEDKIKKVIQIVADHIGVNIGDRLAPLSVKRKYLIDSVDQTAFPKYEEFDITHHFLKSKQDNVLIRVTKRGQNGCHWLYTHTQTNQKKCLETRMQIPKRQFEAFLKHADPERKAIVLKRRCFICRGQYYELDYYFQQPNTGQKRQLMILETYSTKRSEEIPWPKFLLRKREITGEKKFSLYNLSKTQDWLSLHNNF